MTRTNHNWAIVLAAGDGTRLRELTTQSGISTPKQFCSLRGGRSLLGDALARAARIVPKKRIVVVVAEEHRRFWEPELAALVRENVVVQPKNKGTAAGILLPLLTVLERDPEARIALLPSDHFVSKEYVIESSLRLALESLDEAEGGLTLLGITPDAPETGYGWIVPRESDRLLRPVERFVEKPAPGVAAELFAAGALWNSFLFAVKGETLLRFYSERLPELRSAFERTFGAGLDQRAALLAALYAGLETRDFSRDVLQGNERDLRLEIVPPCGWTDLGTPARVEACLATLREDPAAFQAPYFPAGRAALDLARALGESMGRGRAAALSA
ncbi:MAG: NTP transferase domain-containing protein [Planctomycetes bacterium]|nr:NTP transferase domain-containing protein [Planctomycetota bacterium]